MIINLKFTKKIICNMNVYQHNINTIKPGNSPGVSLDIRLCCHEYFISTNKNPLYIQFPPCKVVALNKSSIFMVFSSIDNYIDTFFSELEVLRKTIVKKIEQKNRNIVINWSSPTL